MEMELKKRGNKLIVKMSGELDHHSSEYFRDVIDNELNKGIFDELILDMSQLQFMDSSGVGVILGRYKKVSSLNGQVIVSGMNSQVTKIAKFSGLLKLVKCYDSLSEVDEKL
ncbi:anti-sigma F factor antagonist [Natranaerobius thermophilus]|uniref:Anti-sigma F factor antagonist n=1 Tax=Natranaerobius thermophilus (strain ATCC BAA-1301 / DSM 18059 / JW/NM-WN-LF) TaxID=457570 RepID=B2A4Z5_NATTJ|nr:anti-sigma F factor antagonist [Natranaerobius thermophilus]ACB85237.1 anti-sigma-factor antagonist [Natranaerobius thermophilus JW/NM-WN-LF]